MRRSICRFVVVGSALLSLAGTGALAARRPRYGGTLRVEIQARMSSLAPPQPTEVRAMGAADEIRALLFEGLVGLGPSGRPRPAIAAAWVHDAGGTKWQFKLRPNVKWQDGSLLTVAEAVAAINGAMTEVRGSASTNGLEVDADQPRQDFPSLLALRSGGALIKKVETAADAPLVGTGPFRLAQWEANRRAVFTANEDYWGGRAYVDTIRLEMGRASRDQLIDLELDKADIVELDPAEARRASQEGRRVWVSLPVELLYLHFNLSRPGPKDRRLREALALSVDRFAIQKVLLRNFGDVPGGVFPPWLSGYSFLFQGAPDLPRARQLAVSLSSPPTVELGYDGDDALAQQVAERVAVNARDIGIRVEVAPVSADGGRKPDSVDALLARARISGPSLDQAAFQAKTLLWFQPISHPDDPGEIYLAERHFLEDFCTVPLVFAPELIGLGPRLRNWMADAWGDWHLDEVWMEAEKGR